jgi:7-cyano-7-deazaguanine synthase
MSMANALVVFSGGQDSTTCLYWAKQRFESVYAVTFDYRQRHSLELESARKIAQMADISHEIIDLGPIFAGLSPLTDHTLPVETYSDAAHIPAGLANTFVPGRNILFFSVAANRAYVHDCNALVVGVSQQDFGGYPDCRQDFISKMTVALASGLERPFEIEAPLMNRTKAETVDLAVGLPGCLEALAYSTTCYNGTFPPCQECNSCLLRQKGFAEADIKDPLLVRASAEVPA